jgi:NTE family protein
MPSVPGLVDTLTAAATVPLDNYSFDTVELLGAKVNEFNEEGRLIGGCQKLAEKKGKQCALDILAPHQVTLYPVQVAFEYIENRHERAWFRNLPTTFELPRDTINKLRAVGRRLLAQDPGYRELMKALNGHLVAK